METIKNHLEFLQAFYKADSDPNRQEVFDFTASATDDLLCANQFVEMDLVFKWIDRSKLSASAITALLRMTYCAANVLPNRLDFLYSNEVHDAIVESRGQEGAEKFFKNMKENFTKEDAKKSLKIVMIKAHGAWTYGDD